MQDDQHTAISESFPNKISNKYLIYIQVFLLIIFILFIGFIWNYYTAFLNGHISWLSSLPSQVLYIDKQYINIDESEALKAYDTYLSKTLASPYIPKPLLLPDIVQKNQESYTFTNLPGNKNILLRKAKLTKRSSGNYDIIMRISIPSAQQDITEQFADSIIHSYFSIFNQLHNAWICENDLTCSLFVKDNHTETGITVYRLPIIPNHIYLLSCSLPIPASSQSGETNSCPNL